jgi:hypothetical protein
MGFVCGRAGNDVAIEEGRYISLDAAETLSTSMVNGSADPVRFLKVAGDLIVGAAKAVNGEPVLPLAECVRLYYGRKVMQEGALSLERLWDQIARSNAVGVLCGYSLGSFQGGVGSHIFEKICAER